MMVDLAHVSSDVMRQVLNTTMGRLMSSCHNYHMSCRVVSCVMPAPVMFSHSGARSVCSHPRNVPDDVLQLMPSNGGIVMVNFYTCYVRSALVTSS